jgi:putative IMPACT (imprinted ancient) family translation regulator
LIRDVFRTIESRTEHREKIERSEFLGLAFPCETEEQFMTELEAARKRHFDVRRSLREQFEKRLVERRLTLR